ncbi:hypothetical protein TNCV_1895821 [Trichonephila clavipes]|nr:hypothetical protein TNCV_1895821 [Trichonephila clavipes]
MSSTPVPLKIRRVGDDAQASSSSLDYGLKLRGPSPNNLLRSLILNGEWNKSHRMRSGDCGGHSSTTIPVNLSPHSSCLSVENSGLLGEGSLSCNRSLEGSRHLSARGPAPFSIPLHPAGRRVKGFSGVKGLWGRSKAKHAITFDKQVQKARVIIISTKRPTHSWEMSMLPIEILRKMPTRTTFLKLRDALP